MPFGRVDHDCSFGYEVPQKFHLHLLEATLLGFEVERLLPQNLEHFSHYLFMEFLVIRGSNDDVIHKPE
jgi:hypothetical protein